MLKSLSLSLASLFFLTVFVGCSKPAEEDAKTGTQAASEKGPVTYCDFQDGPKEALVKVEAFYPGRHEETLAAVKGLVAEFPGKVAVEVIDWRHEKGRARRDATGMSCAGVMINGSNVAEISRDGKTIKVQFLRGMDGDWTKDDLYDAVRQTIAGSEKK